MSTHNIQFHDKTRKQSLNICFLELWKAMGLKNEFELAKVNEPSVFESSRFYRIWSQCHDLQCSRYERIKINTLCNFSTNIKQHMLWVPIRRDPTTKFMFLWINKTSIFLVKIWLIYTYG